MAVLTYLNLALAAENRHRTSFFSSVQASRTTVISLVQNQPASVDKDAENQCGEPLVRAREVSFGIPISTLGDLSREKIFEVLQRLSKSNVTAMDQLLQPYSSRELQIFKILGLKVPAMVHRLPFEKLKSVLAHGAILSPREANSKNLMLESPFTPNFEDSLFGGHDCVFVSVGPRNGRQRYGDVALRVKPRSVRSWATPASGWAFIEWDRGGTTGKSEASLDDRRHFMLTVVTDRDWQSFYPMAVIAFLRSRESNERETLLDHLLNQPSLDKVWSFIDANRLGYLGLISVDGGTLGVYWQKKALMKS
jgi:hypothetical protein